MVLQTAKSLIGKTALDALEKLAWLWYWAKCPLIREALKRMPASQLRYAVNISLRYQYVYIDNPKTGCSSLKSALTELELRDTDSPLDSYDWKVFHDRSVSPMAGLGDIRGGKSLTQLVAEGYRFVSFVRNPYTRLLSAYRDKMMRNRKQKKEILKALGYPTADIERPVSFEEFVKAVVGQSDYAMNPHWRVQKSQILMGIVNYSYIGRLENYADDYQRLFIHLGIPAAEIPPLRHLNISKEGNRENCRDYYTPELQGMVYERYKEDFETFGYGYDLPV